MFPVDGRGHGLGPPIPTPRLDWHPILQDTDTEIDSLR
jgi:hypothetical protein